MDVCEYGAAGSREGAYLVMSCKLMGDVGDGHRAWGVGHWGEWVSVAECTASSKLYDEVQADVSTVSELENEVEEIKSCHDDVGPALCL